MNKISFLNGYVLSPKKTNRMNTDLSTAGEKNYILFIKIFNIQ